MKGLEAKRKRNHSFTEQVFTELSIYYVPDTVLDPGESRVNHNGQIPCPHGYSLKMEGDRQSA